MRPRLRLHPLRFAPETPAPSSLAPGSPAGCSVGAALGLARGPVQAQGWPSGDRAGVGKAWASGFQARASEPFLGFCSPRSHWESFLLLPHCDKQTLYRLCNLVLALEKGTLTYQTPFCLGEH